MRKLMLISIILCLFFVSEVFAQDPGDIIWSNSYGGDDREYCYSMSLTADGGCIMGGYSNSFGTGTTDNDVYLVKTDADGDTLWTRSYAGIGTDKCKSVQQCSDGGYIIAGETNSYGAGNYDVYLMKTDAIGDTLWTRTYGGTGIDRGVSVIEATDGGYVVTGTTGSFGAGGKDVYLIKTDVNGTNLWTKTIGAIDDEEGQSVQLTTDGGYIIAGFTESFGAGNKDAYLIKTDANGDTLWTSTHGGTDDDRGYSVQQCNDGSFIIAGDTKSSGAGLSDFYLVKTDANGEILWSNAYGGSLMDIGYSVQQDSDGGYIIAGSTQSFNVGYFDIYLIKTDAIGDTIWTRTYGSFDYEHGRSVQLTTDGNYAVAGWTFSYGPGITAFWFLKIAGEGTSFFPPENLYVDDSIGLATWEPPLSRDLIGYNIYLDGFFINFTSDLFWQYDDLEVGTTYLAGVSALYDDPGESVIIEYEFTYTPVFDPPENLYVDESTGLATWEAPAGELGFNDDFESYDDFVLEFDPWTLIDIDGCITYYIIGHTFPNQNYYGSYIIFNPSQVDPPLEDVVPHSGDKMAACFAASNPLYLNDDWMITPAITINGGDEVSFFAKTYTDQYGLERFNVAVSTTGTSPADFTVISPAPYVEPPVEWTEYNYDLSTYADQSVYVAIQCVSADAFIFFVDDFHVGPPADVVYANNPVMNGKAGREIAEYIPGKITSAENTPGLSFDADNSNNTRSRELLGYKIYQDGVYIQFTTDLFWQYDDLVVGTTYLAGVSALYDDPGESEIIQYSFTYTGVDVNDIVNIITTLKDNYPNPFNPTTTISFSTKEAGHVSLNIYNMKGQLVKKLVNEQLEAAYHDIVWNGKDNNNKSISSGIYFYKMRSSNYTATKKMILMK